MVFMNALAETDAEFIRAGQRSGHGSGGRGDDDVDGKTGIVALDFAREILPHAQARAIDAHAVEERIRAREINVFEDTGAEFLLQHDAGLYAAVQARIHHFAMRDIAGEFIAERLEHRIF